MWARLTTPASSSTTNGTIEDRLLTADDVHAQTQLSARWLYRHADTLPFTRRIGRKVLFSSAGLAKMARDSPAVIDDDAKGGRTVRGDGRIYRRGAIWWV